VAGLNLARFGYGPFYLKHGPVLCLQWSAMAASLCARRALNRTAMGSLARKPLEIGLT